MVAAPLGLMVPRTVALLLVTEVADCVVTVGGSGGVVNDRRLPSVTSTEFEPIAQ